MRQAIRFACAALFAICAAGAGQAKDTVTGPTFGHCSLGGSNWDCEGGIICSCCDTSRRTCWICEAEDDDGDGTSNPLGGTCEEEVYSTGNPNVPDVTAPQHNVLEQTPQQPTWRPHVVAPQNNVLEQTPQQQPTWQQQFHTAPGAVLSPSQ
jgi:hypothetical protein